jgi:hypothetical protein
MEAADQLLGGCFGSPRNVLLAARATKIIQTPPKGSLGSGCRGTCFCCGQCTAEDELVGIRLSRWGLRPLAYVSGPFRLVCFVPTPSVWTSVSGRGQSQTAHQVELGE